MIVIIDCDICYMLYCILSFYILYYILYLYAYDGD